MLQFEKIVDLYQSNKLKSQSVYETFGEKFNKWSKTINRKKRNYNKKEKVDTKHITTILNNIGDLLYIYDSHKQGVSHINIAYSTGMTEGSISSYLNIALFLIEEKGYKILLTANDF